MNILISIFKVSAMNCNYVSNIIPKNGMMKLNVNLKEIATLHVFQEGKVIINYWVGNRTT
jgi:hypothetical protein